jgi:CelD/BcsL family acetyltransferase involved in cellulose biosynthesis
LRAERLGVTTRILSSLQDIEAHEGEWRVLEQRCSDPMSYFQTFDWCRAWVAEFCDSSTQPYVISLWRQDSLLAIVPLVQTRKAGIVRLVTLGEAHAQYCGALAYGTAAIDPEVIEALRLAVRASQSDVWVQRCVIEGSPLDRMIAGIARVREEPNHASVLDLSPYNSTDDYFGQLGKLQKRNRNRRRNHLARLGALSFEVVFPDSAGFDGLVDQAVSWKREWLAHTGKRSLGFSADGYAQFLKNLAGSGEGRSGACVSVLRAGERIVALELGFLHHRHYYAYIGSFDWSLRALSPGKVQMEMTVGWLIEEGVRAYDLLVNPADYKNSWTNQSLAVATRAKPLTWKGRVYTGYWLPTLRPQVKRVYEHLPHLLRKWTSFLQGSVCLLLYV